MKKITLITSISFFLLQSCSTKTNSNADNQANDTVQTSLTQQDGVNEEITEKYWKLITLEGQAVTMAENQEREVYFTLKTTENRVEGFAGCNNLNGTYKLEKGNRIRFEQMAVTMMACPDVSFNESAYLQVFELADNYTIYNDTLNLNVGRRAPLAVFAAVYF